MLIVIQLSIIQKKTNNMSYITDIKGEEVRNSLIAYARQFLGRMDKPDVDIIEGLSPAISIEQKSRIVHKDHW